MATEVDVSRDNSSAVIRNTCTAKRKFRRAFLRFFLLNGGNNLCLQHPALHVKQEYPPMQLCVRAAETHPPYPEARPAAAASITYIITTATVDDGPVAPMTRTSTHPRRPVLPGVPRRTITTDV